MFTYKSICVRPSISHLFIIYLHFRLVPPEGFSQPTKSHRRWKQLSYRKMTGCELAFSFLRSCFATERKTHEFWFKPSVLLLPSAQLLSHLLLSPPMLTRLIWVRKVTKSNPQSSAPNRSKYGLLPSQAPRRVELFVFNTSVRLESAITVWFFCLSIHNPKSGSLEPMQTRIGYYIHQRHSSFKRLLLMTARQGPHSTLA